MLQLPCFYFWGPIHLVCHVHQLTNDVSLHKVNAVCFQCLTVRSRNYFDWRFHSSLSFVNRNSPKRYIEAQVSPWQIDRNSLTDSLPHTQIMLISRSHCVSLSLTPPNIVIQYLCSKVWAKVNKVPSKTSHFPTLSADNHGLEHSRIPAISISFSGTGKLRVYPAK